MNKYPRGDEHYDPMQVDMSIEADQVTRLAALKADRDNDEVERLLGGIRDVAAGDENLLYPMRDALRHERPWVRFRMLRRVGDVSARTPSSRKKAVASAWLNHVEIDWNALRAAAEDARDHAYAPYSDHPVGAAALSNDGRIVSECNGEHRSAPRCVLSGCR